MSTAFRNFSEQITYDDDFYCGDANCPYCADLRAAFDQRKKAQESNRRQGNAA